MEKKYISIGQETLAYVDEGQGDVVLMLHGNMSSGIHYEPLIQRLQDSYRCIAVDLRGFGDSTYNQRFDTLGELAEDVKLFLDALDIPSVFLVGWSNGGGVGLELCARYPEAVKKFFSIEGASLKGYPLTKKDASFQPTLEPYASKEEVATDPLQVAPVLGIYATGNAALMSTIWDATIYTVNKPTQEQNDCWMAETLKQRNLVDLDWALANLNMSHEASLYRMGDGTIDKVQCPVALTTADKDLVVPAYMVMENVTALGDKATLLHYENCGHSPMVDCPDRMAADIRAFFA